MRPRNYLMIAIAATGLAACDLDRTTSPTAGPSLLIGGSPLLPSLLAPLEFQLWSWTETRTGDVTYWAVVDVLVNESLFADRAESSMRLVTTTVYRGGMGRDLLERISTTYLAEIDPQASGTDGYALVVIALPMSDRESSQLEAALAAGTVDVDVTTELVATGKDGGDDILDALGALLPADPRPSSLPIPGRAAH